MVGSAITLASWYCRKASTKPKNAVLSLTIPNRNVSPAALVAGAPKPPTVWPAALFALSRPEGVEAKKKLLLFAQKSKPSSRSFVRETSITFTCSRICCTPPTLSSEIDLGIVIRRDPLDLGRLIRLGDEPGEDHAVGRGADGDRGMGKLLLENQIQLARVAEHHHVDRVDVVLFVPQIDLGHAGLLGEDLNHIGRERRQVDHVLVVDLGPWNLQIECQQPAAVDGHLEPLVGHLDFMHDRRGRDVLADGERRSAHRQHAGERENKGQSTAGRFCEHPCSSLCCWAGRRRGPGGRKRRDCRAIPWKFVGKGYVSRCKTAAGPAARSGMARGGAAAFGAAAVFRAAGIGLVAIGGGAGKARLRGWLDYGGSGRGRRRAGGRLL